jgi:hypothetical protein
MSAAVTDTFAILAQAQCHFITVVQLEDHTLQIQQDVDNIFLNAIDRRVLVQHASDRDFGRSETRHGRQNTRRSALPKRVAVATLKGLQSHLGTVGAELFNTDGFGFQQIFACRLPLNTPARYTGKAGEAP